MSLTFQEGNCGSSTGSDCVLYYKGWKDRAGKALSRHNHPTDHVAFLCAFCFPSAPQDRSLDETSEHCHVHHSGECLVAPLPQKFFWDGISVISGKTPLKIKCGLEMAVSTKKINSSQLDGSVNITQALSFVIFKTILSAGMMLLWISVDVTSLRAYLSSRDDFD